MLQSVAGCCGVCIHDIRVYIYMATYIWQNITSVAAFVAVSVAVRVAECVAVCTYMIHTYIYM